jgi:phosphoribosylanthranilate isomerase
MRIKICGITELEQGCAIANLGATALGFICVPASPRYQRPDQIRLISNQLPASIARIGVFANSTLEEICQVFFASNLTGIQLHGNESPEFCTQLRRFVPNCEIIKAIRVRSSEALLQASEYINFVDTLLLDAYHPQMLGGTGQTLDWQMLQQFQPAIPWFLAGGLTPDNILEALNQVQPDGIDLSSGVEKSPGDKDLEKVTQLFTQLRKFKEPEAKLSSSIKI